MESYIFFIFSMSSSVFKVIRRTMPITNTKMDWNLHSYKLVKNLK